MPSPTRTALIEWLGTKEVTGKTLDIGGNVWSMKEKVKSFEGVYLTLDESGLDLNSRKEVVERYELAGKKRIGFWDNIFCTEVMQFVYNPVNALDNINTLMAPWGSKLYLSFHLNHPPMKGHDYLRYTEKGIRRLLAVGFKIDEFLEPLPGYFLVQCSRS